MRIAIVADVHANLAALEAVLRHAEKERALDGLWCLGDTVGYGPDPNECIDVIARYASRVVVGNHDLAAIGQLDTSDFNADAATAAFWTAKKLSSRSKSYLAGLPQVVREGSFTLVHGTLRWPIWEYLYTYEAAVAHLNLQQTPFGLVGHTHVPLLIVADKAAPAGCRAEYLADGCVVELQGKLVFNPGGVGQPRDGDPRAAYAVYDSNARAIALHRVEYDIATTQKRMVDASLPTWLMERLSLGR